MRATLQSQRKARAHLARRYCGVAAAIVGSAVVGGVASSAAAKKASKAQQSATDANAYQGEIATDQYENYKKDYRPLEQELIAEAKNAGSPQEYDKAAADAASTVSTQLALADQRLTRTPGLDPSSAAATAAKADLAIKGAAISAGEQNKARDAVTSQAFAKKQDVASLGRGIASSASSGLASASAGAAAIAQSASQQAGQTAAGVGNLFSGVVNGLTKIGGVGGSAMDTFAKNNAGVTASTGLSANELATAF